MKRYMPLLAGMLLSAGCGMAPQSALPAVNSPAAADTIGLPLIAIQSAARSTPTAAALPAVHLDVKNFAEVSPTLYRGGRPDGDLLADMKHQGVKTDINLMGAIPGFDTALILLEQHQAENAGLKFVNVKVPMTGTIPQAIADQFFKTVLDPAHQPCYVHCMYGRDRTGVMVALYRMRVDGYTGQQALTEAEKFGYLPTRFPALTKFLLAYKAK
jgi:protein tyrosine/serine phosphatase